jgi:hypothetical protein
MVDDIFNNLIGFYHKKTLGKEWKIISGNGNKKLDEIQTFVKFLENNKEEIKSVDFFDQNFKYKERDVDEPGDLKYLGQVYQITHGNTQNYQNFQKNKNDRIKKGLFEAFILPAKDVALPDRERYEYYLQDLKKKENSAKDNIILLIRIERKFVKANYNIKTKWQNAIFVFDDKNVSVKKQ